MASVGAALGVGSGLELNTLLNNLMSAERIPLTKLQAKEVGVQSKITAYGTLNSSLSSLRDVARALTETRFNGATATSSKDEFATAVATNSATRGAFSLEVLSLAKNQRVASGSVDNADALFAGGTLSFTFGTAGASGFEPTSGEPKTVTIEAGSTLKDVRDSINKASIGVTATLVNDGKGSRLVLAGTNTGAANAFTIESAAGTGVGASLSLFDYDPTSATDYDPDSTAGQASRLAASADARFKVDGLEITNGSNKVEDAVQGVTLTLKQEGTAQITIGQEASSARSALQGLVNAYNSLLTTSNQLAVNTPSETRGEAGTTGPLAGDSLLRNAITRIRNEIVTPLEGATGEYTSLAALGLTFQKDGTLTLDATRFDKAMAEDSSAVARLFEADAYGVDRPGLGARLADQIDGIVKANGEIEGRVASLQGDSKLMLQQQERLEFRLTQIEARYRAQFTSLDTMLSSMNNTMSFLTQQFDALAKLRSQ